MAFSGVIKEFGMHGKGVIVQDTSGHHYRMHVKDLVNGGEHDLKPHVPVAFDIVNEEAVRVSIHGRKHFFGCVDEFREYSGWIRADSGTMLPFDFNDIFRTLPLRITEGSRVTYNLSPHVARAKNIRFEASALTASGKVIKYNDDRAFGLIRPRGARSSEHDVFFHLRGVINAEEVRRIQGMNVTFELERVPALRKVAPIKATEIQEDQSFDAATIAAIDAIQKDWSTSFRATSIRIQHPAIRCIQEVQHCDRVADFASAAKTRLQPKREDCVPESWEDVAIEESASSFHEAGFDQMSALPPGVGPLVTAAPESIRSDVSIMSWVTSAAHTTTGACFLMGTAFRSQGGAWVRAAELHHGGGDVLEGPGGTHVKVMRVERLSPQRREFVQLRTAIGNMVTTADHDLLVEDANTGQPVNIQANAFKQWEGLHGTGASSRQAANPPRVYDGEEFQMVEEIKTFQKYDGVVAITFEHESDAVLAWTFPGRRPRTVLPGSSIACRGRPHWAENFLEQKTFINASGFAIRHSFIDEPTTLDQEQHARSRSSSTGATPSSHSRWSKGTRLHKIGSCVICWEHRRHVLDPRSPPCKSGALCDKCHEQHAECGQRPANRPRGPR
ncbi:unnamed protein product [Polarella glacialis]|uniref:Uncharacterized protein n=1 Tax=Polarella glacialis TaxID=89957 RepID=A0A813HR57_POLGL|nr:unnamed protein product [Polarella glacialis]